jgi:hypothetical protein
MCTIMPGPSKTLEILSGTVQLFSYNLSGLRTSPSLETAAADESRIAARRRLLSGWETGAHPQHTFVASEMT